MQRRIGEHLSYGERMYRLLDLAISHDDEREVPVRSVDYVALLLMGRMANDMRAITSLARLGYGVQASTLAASVFEVAFTFADVLTDDEAATADGTDDEGYCRRESCGMVEPFKPTAFVHVCPKALTKFVDRWRSLKRKSKRPKETGSDLRGPLPIKHGNPRGYVPPQR